MNALGQEFALRLRGLHLLTRVALRLRPPLEAKALVDRIAQHMPRLRGADGARAAVCALRHSGSCLSRAVAIAAATPGADVVIGVDMWSSAQLAAHAWVEVDGECVDTSLGGRPLPTELARLGPTSPAVARSPTKRAGVEEATRSR
jgi:hypothetical protein